MYSDGILPPILESIKYWKLRSWPCDPDTKYAVKVLFDSDSLMMIDDLDSQNSEVLVFCFFCSILYPYHICMNVDGATERYELIILPGVIQEQRRSKGRYLQSTVQVI